MGHEERDFHPSPRVSLEDLVRDKYAAIGRPSVDPIVFFKLQLVMFFEASGARDS